MLLLFHRIGNDRSSVIKPGYVYHLETYPYHCGKTGSGQKP
jgi:hypothetical protein